MQPAVAATHPEGGNLGVRRAVLAGLAASLVGIGLARFAYTPLLPALIDAHWFAPAAAAYLGAANLAGYLAGALLARRMAEKASPPAVLRAMMALATVSFFACAAPLSFLWFFLWRFASGLAGGALMALAAPTVLPHVLPSRRGFAGGVIFTGVGLGIAISGTLVPLLLRAGLVAAWCGLGMAALALTLAAWRGWPDGPANVAPAGSHGGSARAGLALKALYAEYGLNAIALVPHMVFFVDFVARGLGEGLETGARYWIVFGAGAAVGPLLAGRLADRIGFRTALRLALLMQGAAVALLLVTTRPAALAASSLVVGAIVPGIVPLVLGRIHELAPSGGAAPAAWSVATTAFALGQAGAAWLFSFLFAHGGDYRLLFALGAGALLLALVIDLAANAARNRPGGASRRSRPL